MSKLKYLSERKYCSKRCREIRWYHRDIYRNRKVKADKMREYRRQNLMRYRIYYKTRIRKQRLCMAYAYAKLSEGIIE